MWSTAREIADGDTVIVWLTRDVIQPLLIQAGKELNGRFGVYSHSDLIGKPYGSKIGSRNGKGFIHVLRPTPELWTMALPHRTQILYQADIAFITSCLAIRPGSRVIEAGTGSGSFSHSVARTIGHSGHLWSYEFHEARAKKAREEFDLHGLSNIITLTQRNVCKDGFTVSDLVDAVFLDLPAPWDAVQHAKSALRVWPHLLRISPSSLRALFPGPLYSPSLLPEDDEVLIPSHFIVNQKDCMTRICCFSPCMEQVLRTVSALNEFGFTDISMNETLVRPHEVSTISALQPISSIATKLQIADVKREERRQKQISQARTAKRKREEEAPSHEPGEDSANEVVSKRARTHEDDAGDGPMIVDEQPPSSSVTTAKISPVPAAQNEDLTHPDTKLSVTRILQEVRGHTSYLTFASLLPVVPTLLKPDASENGSVNH